MLSPATSPVLVGRARELEALRDAQRMSMAGSPRGAVVLGEAGIGKSRLLHEFADGLGDDVVVAVGQCIAGAVPLALQPIRGLLRDLLSHFDPERLGAVTGPSARLLPAALTGLIDAPDTITQEQLQEAIPALLQGISTIAPLVLIIEDVHWADAASLDLLRSLLRSLRQGRMLVAVTHRSGEVGPEHPSHAFILELERARDVSLIALRRLTLEETVAQARAIRRTDMGPDAARALFARSEGVPFYVEELLAVERFGPLPETLRELLLGRYATLSTDTQVLVRLVAAGGPRVQHRLVTRVHNGDTGSLDRAMRQAIAAQVLRADGDAYRFRHALIHEAVHGELLPGEVHRFHARYAEALEADARMDSRHAEIAHHWQLADDDPRTLAALVAASHEARADGAPGAAAELGQQALALWTRVDTPERVAGCSSAQLLLEVGSALDAASDPQALPFLERSVEEVPEPDRRGRALLLHQAMLVRDSEGLAGALDLGRRALELLPDEGDDEARLTRVRVETGVGVVELMNELRTARGRLQVAVAQARELIARADDASIASRASVELARGLSHLGAAQVIDGEVERGFAALAEAGRYSGADVEDAVRRHMLRAWLLYYLGRYRESLAAAHEGGEIATSWGMARGFGAAMAVLDAWSRLALGELDAAAAVARGVREAGPVHTARAYCAEIEAELMLLRDEPQAAATVLSESQGAIDRLRSNSRSNDLRFARLDAEIALAVGNPGAAFAALEPLWNWPDPRPGPSFAALGVGARVVARLRRGPTPLPGISLADAEQRLRRVLDQLSVWDVAEDWRALLEAELSGDDVTAWQTARDAAVRGRVPKRLHVHALERLAAAQVRAGDRDAAATAIDEAAAIADRAGMLEASRAIGALAARARLQTRREHPQDGSALTARERQVLDLIAQGLTNRQIGDRLFISAKTASVHVSAILRKLGAATRAEAAARARDIL